MRLKYLIAAFAALAIISCGKDSGEEKQGGNTSPVDENGISSLLIREKGQTEWVSSLDISLVTGTTTSLEWQILPESVKDLPPRLASDDVLVARVTQQGSLMARKKVGESTTIRVFVGEKEYATATVHVLPDQEDTDISEDPSEGPKERVTLDKNHWFFYCAVCDEFESIAQKSEHSGTDQFSTWAPFGMIIALVEDPDDPFNTLIYGEDNIGYSYKALTEYSFEFEDPDWGGEGIYFTLNPSAPWNSGEDDPFLNSRIQLSYEDDNFIAPEYSPNGFYRGLTGWLDELTLSVYSKLQDKWYQRVLKSGSKESNTLSFSTGDELKIDIIWYSDKLYYNRSKVESEGWGTVFRINSSDESVAAPTKVELLDDGTGMKTWRSTVSIKKTGSASLTISSGESRGKLGSTRIIHLEAE